MPNPVARSFLGIAKDAVVTTLAAAVAAGATTVTVVGTGVAASSTIFIWDGPLSESRAISAGGGTSTLTVPALTNAHPANVLVTAQLTASVGPTDYIPVTTIKPTDRYALLEDKGYRGSMGDVYGGIQGPRFSEFELAGDAFPDTIGYLLGGMLGAVDFAGGTPNTHTMALKNTGDGQPTPFTLYDFDVVNTRAFPGQKISDFSLKFGGDDLLSWTAKSVGYAGGVVANPTASFSSVAILPSWLGLITLGGAANLTVIDGEINMKRPVAPIQTHDGTQDPYKVFSGILSVDGKLTFVMEDDTQLANLFNNSQPALTVSFTSGAGASQTQIAFTCTKAAYQTAQVERGKDYIAVPVSFEAILNTTDANTAGTGLSPIKVTLKNAKATGTYQ